MENKTRRFLIVITGPTGVGKTTVCTRLASIYGSPVLSADARQFYREMKIGTAAPSQEQQQSARHYFTGNLSIHDYYNASMYEAESLSMLSELFKSTYTVFMAGGSGLYIDAVCRGIDDLPTVDPELREELAQQYRLNGIAWLRQKLKKLDPDHYEVVDLKNPNRILKSVEISLMTGKPYSSMLTGRKKRRDFDIIKIGLNLERERLYEQINSRVDKMIEQGLLEEARDLCRFRNLNALKTVGYKELFDYFDNKTSLDRAVELIKRNSRHYAKRQLTWLARDKEIHWFQPDEPEKIQKYIELTTGILPGRSAITRVN